MKDERGIVLDFLEKGHGGVGEPVAQLVGTRHFNLLEVVIRDGETVENEEEVYIGEGKREKVKYIKGRITKDELTANARADLDRVLQKLVDENEERFIKFFNEAEPITTRMHSLELLPGVGKKHMWQIIDARDVEPFETFDDLQERVELIPDPRKLLVKRIIAEMEGDEKYYLFLPSPKSKR